MDGPALSRRELRILARIEAELRTDRWLDRCLSTMRIRRLRLPGTVPLVLWSATAGSFALLGLAVAFDLPALVAGVIVIWSTAALLLFLRAARSER